MSKSKNKDKPSPRRQQIYFTKELISPRRRPEPEKTLDEERITFFKSYLYTSNRKKRKETKIFDPRIDIPGLKRPTTKKADSESDSDFVKFEDIIHYDRTPRSRVSLSMHRPSIIKQSSILHEETVSFLLFNFI